MNLILLAEDQVKEKELHRDDISDDILARFGLKAGQRSVLFYHGGRQNKLFYKHNAYIHSFFI